MGKGSEQRPTDVKRFNAAWDAIFGAKKAAEKDSGQTLQKRVRKDKRKRDITEI